MCGLSMDKMSSLVKCAFGASVIAITAFLCITLSSYIADETEFYRPSVRPRMFPILLQTIETADSVTMVSASPERAGLFVDMVQDCERDAQEHNHHVKMRKVERDATIQKRERDLKAQKNFHDTRSRVLKIQQDAEKEHLREAHKIEIKGLEAQRRMAERSLSLSSSDSY